MFFGLYSFYYITYAQQGWAWTSDNIPILMNAYTNWDDNEPNIPASRKTQDCTLLRKNNKWDDTECKNENFFMCEKN